MRVLWAFPIRAGIRDNTVTKAIQSTHVYTAGTSLPSLAMLKFAFFCQFVSLALIIAMLSHLQAAGTWDWGDPSSNSLGTI